MIVDKSRVEHLAIFGAKPASDDMLHVGSPNIGNRDRFFERMKDMFDRRWLTNQGPFVEEFEQKIADFIGVKHCIAICNATIGLEIAIRALDLCGEVILPSFTFIATAHALHWLGIKPIFCDIDPSTHNIDPKKVEELITDRTSGIFGVHVWGRPCDIQAFEIIAKKYNLKLLFDAAHAFGCSYQGRMTGNFGDLEVFSFHATKFFNTFEGGAIATHSDEVAQEIRLMKNFGFRWYDEVVCAGTNGKMSEASAAMGLTNLESLDEFIAVNRRNYLQYQEVLDKLPGVHLIRYDEHEKNNYQYVVLEIDEALTGIRRDEIIKILHAENILARRYFFPGCHQMEPYRSIDGDARSRLGNTESLARRVISLPTGERIGPQEVAMITRIIRLVTQNGREIAEKLAESR